MGAPMIAPVPELPRNDKLAEQFDLLADLMELEGADGFRIGAYRKAAARIRETPSSVAQLALDGKAKQLQDIGKTIEAKIVEVVDDGEIHALTKRKADVPAEVAVFMRLPGLGSADARDGSGPRHHCDGRRRCRAGRLLLLARLGRRRGGEGADQGDCCLARRLAVRPPGRAARELRQPAPALHRLQEPQRRVA